MATSPSPSPTESLPPGVVASIRTGISPESATFAFGSIWVSNHRPGTITRIDPARNRVLATVDVGGRRIGPLVAAGGRLWVSSADKKAFVAIDPATNEPALTIPCECEEEGGLVAFGEELLFLPSETEIWHADPTSGAVKAKTAKGAGHRLIPVGTRLFSLSENEVSEFDANAGKPAGRATEVDLGEGAIDLSVAGETIWFATSDGTISTFDTDARTASTLAKIDVSDLITDPDTPLLITAAENGLYLRPSSEVIIRVDGTSGRAGKRFEGLPSGQFAGYLLVAEGSLWAPNFGAGTVWRLSLDAL